MATSKSNDTHLWHVSVAIYSGRPDPHWSLESAKGVSMLELWQHLTPTTRPVPTAPALGYRGCTLRHGTTRVWHAFGGVVSLTAVNVAETRADPTRTFEQMLIDSAPKGLLPRALIESEFQRDADR